MMKMRTRNIVLLILAIIAVLLSGCGNPQKKAYKDISKRYKEVKYSGLPGYMTDEDYEKILVELEAINGYPDADIAADEIRDHLYERVLSYLSGNSSEYYYGEGTYEAASDLIRYIRDYKDISGWEQLNEAAHLMSEGHSSEAVGISRSLPDSFDRIPLNIGIRICDACAQEDWAGALELTDEFNTLLTRESAKEAVGSGADSISKERIPYIRMMTLVYLLHSPGIGIPAEEPGSINENDIERSFQSVYGTFLYNYHREAFFSGEDLAALEQYPLESGEKTYDFIEEEIRIRTERLQQELKEKELYDLYSSGQDPVSPETLNGTGICIITKDKESNEILLNDGEEAEYILEAIPLMDLCADSVETLRYICRFESVYTPKYEVTTINQKTGGRSKRIEYEIVTNVKIFDTVTGKVIQDFRYWINQHDNIDTSSYVIKNEIIPALHDLITNNR